MWGVCCRAGAEVVTGDEGFQAILGDPEVAGVDLVLPPHVGPKVRSLRLTFMYI